MRISNSAAMHYSSAAGNGRAREARRANWTKLSPPTQVVASARAFGKRNDVKARRQNQITRFALPRVANA
jgi:hypothetical protein